MCYPQSTDLCLEVMYAMQIGRRKQKLQIKENKLLGSPQTPGEENCMACGGEGGGGGGGGVSKSADCTSLFLITLIEPAHNEVARNVTSFH